MTYKHLVTRNGSSRRAFKRIEDNYWNGSGRKRNLPEELSYPKLCRVTYRDGQTRRLIEDVIDLWCATAGDRVYEAMYYLRDIGKDARRVRVAELPDHADQSAE